jgi:frataxin-like iron-binding protein CyaY
MSAYMTTKQQAEAQAQVAANESGHIHFAVKLNPFSSMSWVVRVWSESLAREAAKEDGTVIACCPH